MNAARIILFNLLGEVPESKISEVIGFIGYLKLKREKDLYKDLQKTSE